MRGEPVLPSRFLPLFDYPLENDSNIEQSRKMSILYHKLDNYCEKFDENLSEFNRRITQSVADIRELLIGSYTRFSYLEEIPEINNIENKKKEIIDILDQATIENDNLPEPLVPEIIQQETKPDK